MENKILIELIVPQIDQQFSVYIPVNIKIGKIHNNFNKVIKDITNGLYDGLNNNLYDSDGTVLKNDQFVIETKLCNGSSIILL